MKVYLGDSVYVDIDKFGAIVLTTENGFGASNTVILEMEVLDSLLTYLKEQKVIRQ